MIRLQKYLADAGIGSRRYCEQLIQEGRVNVNGCNISEMGYKVNKDDLVFVDGKEVIYNFEKQYFVLNKPRYYLSTVKDPKGRKTIMDLIPDELKKYRLFPVGRLDYDTKGVLLLTNDGEFMNLLVGPKSNTEKEYLVRVKGFFKKIDLNKLCNGIKISDGKNEYVTRKCQAYINEYDKLNNSTSVGIIIKEGKYHQVKNMFSAIGYEVTRLSRIRFGRITLDGIKEGDIRKLSIHEIKALIGDAKS